MTPSITPIAIAVVERDDRFLVGLRPPGVSLAGLAEFPGGKIAPGESPATAAVRECREETGLEVEVLFEYPAHELDYDHGRVALYFFACRSRTANVEPTGNFRWVPRRELTSLDFPRGNAALIQLLTQFAPPQ